jgi:transcriptional regulator with XRE-family HTH domain
MEELEEIVSENLTALRKGKHLTQQELADKIGYSDKSISKWELGKAVPTVDILKDLADFYGVTVDFLITPQSPETREKVTKGTDRNRNNKIVIVAMVATFIWFTAACVYASSVIPGTKIPQPLWIAFIWAIPASVFSSAVLVRIFWGRTVFFVVLASLFVWTFITAFCVTFKVFAGTDLWYIYFVCIPLQIGIILFSQWK